MTSETIYKALLQHKDKGIKQNEVAIIREFRMGTGYGRMAEARIDALEITCWPSKGIIVTAYEIKTSLSDFRNELKKPFKRIPAVIYSNRFYFIAPLGIIPKDEVPVEAGLLEVIPETNFVRGHLTAPFRENMAPNWMMVASLIRRLSLSEGGFRKTK